MRQLKKELTKLDQDEDFEIFIDWVKLEKVKNIEKEIQELSINICFPVRRVQADWNIPEYAEENSDECEVTLWIRKYDDDSFHIDFQYDLYPYAQSRANNLPHEDARYDVEGVLGLLKDLRLNRDPYPYDDKEE